MKLDGDIARRLVAVALAGCLAVPGSGLAANLVVANLAGRGAGTLRCALTNAQNGDTILFAVTGLITNVLAGGLTISNNISLIGPGPSLLAITGTNRVRAFSINQGVTTTISGLGFTYFAGWDTVQGYAGGAIYNGGTLLAVDCQFLYNAAGGGGPGAAGNASQHTYWTVGGNRGGGGSGGAIYDAGTASLLNCTIGWNGSGNGGMGGVGANGYWDPPIGPHDSGPGSAGGRGGDAGNGSAAFSLGDATFTGCTFFGNTNGVGGAGRTGGAGYMLNYPGAQGGSGGNAGSGTLYCSGAIQMIACTFQSNIAGKAGNGGNGGAGANDTLGRRRWPWRQRRKW